MKRPEEYANQHLRAFNKIVGMSPKGIHDSRLEIRRFYVVAKTLYPLHLNYEILEISKGILKSLGKIRDMDVHGCPKVNRNTIFATIVKRKNNITELPKLYGSRFMVAQNLFEVYKEAQEANSFHSFRKLLREARFMAESLGLEDSSLKVLVREMGDMRDSVYREICEGRRKSELTFTSDLKEHGLSALKEVLLSDHEFHHIKYKLTLKDNV
ncbi:MULTISPECIES: hypothetical protein [Acidianus]|uniref:CHAD domain-containing protein n=1 Tax=Candidatus Acidianus copahuensis TaxID=1160895 RepID=A0A031LS93_9CREN|nr:MULTISPECIES: hypothetical protein [Acidianus]EZQ10595.1 hypothetical protein CM19_03985 [Candidatus Acidianus copahuensis]NON63147.1 hypothetical protein [Acidianus sp. RZ1]